MVTRHLCDTCRSECSQTCELQVDTDRSEVLHLLKLTMNFELMRQKQLMTHDAFGKGKDCAISPLGLSSVYPKVICNVLLCWVSSEMLYCN